VLAEYKDSVFFLRDMVNETFSEEYCVIPNGGGCEKITGLIRKSIEIDVIREQTRYKIAKIKSPDYTLIVAMIHNISKLHASEETQAENLRELHSDIRKVEDYYGTTNSLIVGDLNVNPFERACISANTLHAIPFLQEVERQTRIVQGREFRMFFNPSWKHYANREAPYTPYRYSNSDMINFYWHIFDQVIIRPDLINAFDDDSLEIINGTKNHNLLGNNNRPDRANYSDHLPIFFSLKEDKIL
jgi:hypothetical protein